MELITLAEISSTAHRQRSKESDGNNTLLIFGIATVTTIILLPLIFICCLASMMHISGEKVGGDGGYERFYNISLDDGYSEIYTAYTREESEELDYIVKYFEQNNNLDLSNAIAGQPYNGNVMLLLQWDSRWGNNLYGNSTIAKGGCGPTCLAMIVNSFGGNVTPNDIASFSVNAGYRVDGVGTSWGLFTGGAEHYGLRGTQISLSKESIKSSIKNGNPIIASMTKGHFTNGGHFIVIADCSDDCSQVYIQDPNSEDKSRWWSSNVVISEAVAMWNFAIK